MAVLVGITILSSPGLGWIGFTASLAMGIIALYSFANGLLIWPIGLGILILLRGGSRVSAVIRMAVWLLVGGVATYLFFFDYHQSNHPQLSFGDFARWPTYVGYVLNYLGAPLAYDFPKIARFLGLGGVMGLLWLVHHAIRAKSISPNAVVPLIGIASYSIGSALLTGVAGSPSPVSKLCSLCISRYPTYYGSRTYR